MLYIYAVKDQKRRYEFSTSAERHPLQFIHQRLDDSALERHLHNLNIKISNGQMTPSAVQYVFRNQDSNVPVVPVFITSVNQVFKHIIFWQGRCQLFALNVFAKSIDMHIQNPIGRIAC